MRAVIFPVSFRPGVRRAGFCLGDGAVWGEDARSRRDGGWGELLSMNGVSGGADDSPSTSSSSSSGGREANGMRSYGGVGTSASR